MSRLNADIEAGLADRHQTNSDEQAFLLEPESQEQQGNTIEQLQNSFQYSKVYNLISFTIPSAKILITLFVLLTGEYNCFGTKQIWLLCMMFHDVFNAYVIVLRLQIIFALNRLNSSESSQINSNPSHESRIQQEIQLSERVGALIPQEQPEEETHPPSQPLHHQRIVQDTSTRTLQIMDKKSKVVKLTTLCTYIWIFLFLFWMEADGIHKVGQCDTKQISDLVYIYFIVGWIWLLNPLIFCMATCLCLPILFLLLWIFRKPQQTPASQSDINNIPVKLYSSEIPGNKECAICMGDYQEGESIIQLECSPLHHFHEDCVKSWLRINGQCPTCRAKIGQRRENS